MIFQYGILYNNIRHRSIDGQVKPGLGIGRPNRGRVGLLEVLARVTSPLESSRPWQIYHVNDWSSSWPTRTSKRRLRSDAPVTGAWA